MRSLTYRGSWTISFVLASDDMHFWGGNHGLLRDGDFGWDNLESSIGIGPQLYCGANATGHYCPGGTREIDRGSCTANTLFGAEYDLCTELGQCPFIVAEGHGPREGDVWCRVARFTNDAAHQCKDEPNKFCHVVTMRAGPRQGTLLRVDEQLADTNNVTMPPDQAGFFGGGSAPAIDTSRMKEVRAACHTSSFLSLPIMRHHPARHCGSPVMWKQCGAADTWWWCCFLSFHISLVLHPMLCPKRIPLGLYMCGCPFTLLLPPDDLI